MYGTAIIYNSTRTTIIWQEIYDLDDQNRKYQIKSGVLLEHGWSESRKIKIQYRENKENQSNNAIKQRNKTRKTKHKEEKLKNTNKIKVKNNRKIIIIHIHNKMPALWDSKVMFVSGSQFWGLALYSPFWSVSGPFVIPHLIISLGGRQKKVGGGKREDPKGKGKKKKRC